MTNEFDKSKITKISKTPLSPASSKLGEAKSYIEVNPRKKITGAATGEDFGSVIVTFDWDTLLDTLDQTYTSSADNIYATYAFYLQENNKFEHDLRLSGSLNKLANENLVSIRTNIADRVGSGSASIVIKNFDYEWLFQKGISDLFGSPLFLEGLYLTIDAKGRFDANRYYRIFTGSVISTTVTDNPTDRSISIECRDLSKFLTASRYNMSPAFQTKDPTAVHHKGIVYANSLMVDEKTKEPLTTAEVAIKLIPDIEGDTWINSDDLYNLNAAQKEMFKVKNEITLPRISGADGNQMIGINYRLSYPVNEASYDKKLRGPYSLVFGYTGPSYRRNFGISKLRFDEFKSRADLLNEVAQLAFFVTYLDASGNIHFHPPRYDYLNTNERAILIPDNIGEGDEGTTLFENPNVYIIDGSDSISESYSQSEDDIVTVLRVTGEGDFGIMSGKQKLDPNIFRVHVYWKQGWARHGFRERKISTAAISGKDATERLKSFALAAFIRLYLERKKATFTMPMRPELEIDRPIFIPDKDLLYHIKGISHSYTAGGDRSPGDFSTTITCFAGRPLAEATLLTANLLSSATTETLIAKLKLHGLDLSIETRDIKTDKVVVTGT